MNIRKGILLLGLFAIALQAAALILSFQYFYYPKLLQVESSSMEKNLHRGVQLIQHQFFHLEQLSQVLVNLPLIQQHTNTLLPPELRSNIENKMSNLEINIMYILNTKHEVMWEDFFDLNAEQPYPSQAMLSLLWEKRPKFLEHNNLLSVQVGLINSSLGPVLLASAPIPDPNSKQIIGTLIIGRLITQETVQIFQNVSFTDVKIWPIGGANLSSKQLAIISKIGRSNADYITTNTEHLNRGYMVIKDLNEQPNLLISVTQPRELYQLTKSSFMEFGFLALGFQVLLLLGILALFRQKLSVPLHQILHRIDHTLDEWQTDEHANLSTDIGLLSHSLSNFMSRQQVRIAQKISYAYREGTLQTRQNLSHEFIEALVPIIQELNSTEKKLSNLPINELETIIAEYKAGDIKPHQIAEYMRKIQLINEKLRLYQKQTRDGIYRLHSKTLRNATAFKAQARSLDTFREFTPLTTFSKKRAGTPRS